MQLIITFINIKDMLLSMREDTCNKDYLWEIKPL